ncbi:MAG: hypothetical protein CMC05_05335 [Flavobacteriaceae bacterium]|nr:hypothetical protein [Flavobacteriaceae bacterium]MBD10863.1 hypothetical protein [Flavobacteriaceae bacterium]|tara:strand:- start:3451 stop:3660 length:210 start_codon:yes stop_codon:yes gene_type:complete
MIFLYFDPGLGAMIVQAIIAAVAGVVLFSKNLMYKIRLFLGLAKKDKEDVFDDINVKDSDIENKNTSER